MTEMKIHKFGEKRKKNKRYEAEYGYQFTNKNNKLHESYNKFCREENKFFTTFSACFLRTSRKKNKLYIIKTEIAHVLFSKKIPGIGTFFREQVDEHTKKQVKDNTHKSHQTCMIHPKINEILIRN